MYLLHFLQEMVREYFGGLAKSKGTSGYRLSVYLYFDNTQEPLTPAEYQDGYNFFKTSRYGTYRMPGGHCLYLQASPGFPGQTCRRCFVRCKVLCKPFVSVRDACCCSCMA